MSLKAIINGILKDKHRSLSWLALSIDKTPDGLRLGLTNESIKYKDILLMAKVLDVSPCSFFDVNDAVINTQYGVVAEPPVEYGDTLKSCRELAATLKDQLKDKERIISLLNQATGVGS